MNISNPAATDMKSPVTHDGVEQRYVVTSEQDMEANLQKWWGEGWIVISMSRVGYEYKSAFYHVILQRQWV